MFKKIKFKTPKLITFFSLGKRQKIVISSVLLSLMLLSTGFLPIYIYISYRFYYILVFGICGYLLSLWSLWEGMNRVKAFTLLILPTLFTIAVANYYFLITIRWLIIVIAFSFGLIFYTLLLSKNIFNVASIRTIPLYRVASFVSFIITGITAFLLFNIILALNLPFFINALAVFIVLFLLSIQYLWTIEMESITSLILVYSGVASLMVSEVALALSFWPTFRPLSALVLAITFSVYIGIMMEYLRDRMSRGVVKGYLIWQVLAVFIIFITTSWQG